MNFNTETAIEDQGNCHNQKIECEKCELGILFFNHKIKDRLDDLCDKDIVFFCAVVSKTLQN